MATRINSGDSIDYTPVADVASGDVIVLGEINGIALVDIVANEIGALALEGIFQFACLSTDVVSVGDALYWDAGNSEATLTASTHKFLGYATTASANGVEVVESKLIHQAV